MSRCLIYTLELRAAVNKIATGFGLLFIFYCALEYAFSDNIVVSAQSIKHDVPIYIYIYICNCPSVVKKIMQSAANRKEKRDRVTKKIDGEEYGPNSNSKLERQRNWTMVTITRTRNVHKDFPR